LLIGRFSCRQSLKGVIFFVWAMVQNLTPFFLGGIADRFGRKRIVLISLALIIVSYVILAVQTAFVPFIAGILLLGFASGLFKPALQGAVASTLNEKTSSTGWGIFFMLLNLAVIAAPPLSKYLKELSWAAVFYGSAAIMFLNLLVSIVWTEKEQKSSNTGIFPSVKTAMEHFARPRIYIFVLAMSGFAIIYMQFYETFQNFIIDWSDTSALAAALPQFMTTETARGTLISYEWLYMINSILITLLIVYVSRLSGSIPKIKAIILGIILSAGGIAIAGTTMSGQFLIGGFIIYTFGEMLTNPKFTDYLGTIAPEGGESMYLGYLNLSMAIGLGGGALLGGYLYGRLGEKSALAIRYMTEHNIINNTDNGQAFRYFAAQLGISPQEATELLWNSYHPWTMWLPFLAIALLSIIILLWYAKKYKY